MDDFLKPYETEEQVRERAERLRKWNDRDQEDGVQPTKDNGDEKVMVDLLLWIHRMDKKHRPKIHTVDFLKKSSPKLYAQIYALDEKSFEPILDTLDAAFREIERIETDRAVALYNGSS